MRKKRRPKYECVSDALEARYIPEPMSGCFIWHGSVNSWGYPRLNWNGKIRMAHRLAWENKNGEIPQGLFVCHKCDVPSCVNPDHMFIGTNADNMRDMKIKGRAPRGSRSAHAKLNEDQVREILSSAESYKDVAKRYGIAEATVSHIRAGFSWKHVKVDQPKRISKQAKLTVDQILTIRKSNEGLKELAARYNVSPENISYIRRGITWRNVNG